MKNVRVRLVPKAPNNRPVPTGFAFASTSSALLSEFEPAPSAAAELERRALGHNLPTTRSRGQRVDVVVPEDRMGSLFHVDMAELSKKSQLSSDRGKPYLAPTSELTIPADLQDMVEFAYVPTPPEFFAPEPLPPSLSLHHLDLADVVMVLNAARAHRKGWTGRDVRVAMTDSGFGRHPYFERNGYTIRRIATTAVTSPATDDVSGHGTGESANVLAVAPDCEFIGVKHDDYSALAIETALAENPRIITNSWGWDIDVQSMAQLQARDPNLFNEVRDLERIITSAINSGTVFVFSAGNGHRAFPACMPQVLSIGGVAVEPNGSLVASNYASSFRSQLYPTRAVPDLCGVVGYSGPPPQRAHIMLPVPAFSELDGENMPAAYRGRGWGVFSGTSAAAPQVAGVIALMLGVSPGLTPQKVRDILVASTIDVNAGASAHGDGAGPGLDLATGAGLTDAFLACQRSL